MSDPYIPSDSGTSSRAILRSYWYKNLILTVCLLAIWAIVSLGCGVLWADKLNAWNLPGTGYPLGFWFAQQGAVVVFVLLILVYAFAMNHLDRKHMEELQRFEGKGGAR